MIIIEDTKNKDKKHKNIHSYFESVGVEVIRHGMLVGDYMFPNDGSICIDTKMSMMEVSNNLYQDHKRFTAELALAQRCEIKLIILIEEETVSSWDELMKWTNHHPNASPLTPNGERCFKIMKALENKYGCRFEFCKHKDTGKKIIEILSSGTK